MFSELVYLRNEHVLLGDEANCRKWQSNPIRRDAKPGVVAKPTAHPRYSVFVPSLFLFKKIKEGDNALFCVLYNYYWGGGSLLCILMEQVVTLPAVLLSNALQVEHGLPLVSSV